MAESTAKTLPEAAVEALADVLEDALGDEYGSFIEDESPGRVARTAARRLADPDASAAVLAALDPRWDEQVRLTLRARERARQAEDALAKVAELHGEANTTEADVETGPGQYETVRVCGECGGSEDDDGDVIYEPWPCPTYQAATGGDAS